VPVENGICHLWAGCKTVTDPVDLLNPSCLQAGGVRRECSVELVVGHPLGDKNDRISIPGHLCRRVLPEVTPRAVARDPV
jgi:hypothetical protein